MCRYSRIYGSEAVVAARTYENSIFFCDFYKSTSHLIVIIKRFPQYNRYIYKKVDAA